MKNKISCSIVIVSFNHTEYLSQCLKSLPQISRKYNYRVIVVDNNSVDGTIERLSQSIKSKVKIIQNNTNLGFARACNQGIDYIKSDYYLILNPDVLIGRQALESMLAFLGFERNAACVVPLLINFNNSIQYSCRKFPGLKETILKRTPLKWIINIHEVNKYDAVTLRLIDKYIPFRIDWALGGCMMVKKSALEKVGLFDERFFLYCEDIDWFYRLRLTGLKAYCFPEAIAKHKHLAVSDKKLFSREAVYHTIGIIRFALKYFTEIVKGRYP